MNWTFSFGWLLAGLLITAAGAAITYYHKQISDYMVHGVSSYDRVKLIGIITVLVGLLVTMNLHTALLNAFVNLVFRR